MIFGANASGKSNLVKAICFSREIILQGLDKVNLNKCYFRIDKNMYKQPGVFEYRIILEDIEYSYGVVVSYVEKVILSEWLVRIEGQDNETYIFNRVVDENNISHAESEARFSDNEEKMKMNFYLDGFSEDISDVYKSKTILSDIAQRTNEKSGVFGEIRDVYEWFKKITILFPESKYKELNNATTDVNKKTFFSNTVHFFDTGIESVESGVQLMDFDELLDDLPETESETIKIELSHSISKHPIMGITNDQVVELRMDDNGDIVYNKLLLNHGNKDDMFDFEDESNGTKRLFNLISLFYENKSDCLILIDEIDRSLHTKLIRKFLELFYAFNDENECQIVATTHDSNLLDLELLRQDEIWFVERQKDHSSKVFFLNKFKDRFADEVEKDYLLGRYGAIPIFDMEFKLENTDG